MARCVQGYLCVSKFEFKSSEIPSGPRHRWKLAESSGSHRPYPSTALSLAAAAHTWQVQSHVESSVTCLLAAGPMILNVVLNLCDHGTHQPFPLHQSAWLVAAPRGQHRCAFSLSSPCPASHLSTLACCRTCLSFNAHLWVGHCLWVIPLNSLHTN